MLFLIELKSFPQIAAFFYFVGGGKGGGRVHFEEKIIWIWLKEKYVFNRISKSSPVHG